MKRSTTLERFFDKIVMLDNGCWEWKGVVLDNGYGKFLGGAAHRSAYRLLLGEVDKSLDLDHTCHTMACPGGVTCPHRRCVNPQHLEPVTRKENLSRGNHNNRGRTHCRRGHEFVEGSYWLSKTGSRQCKPCMQLRNKGPKIYTHCKNEHPFDGKNNKQQICRICARARNKAYKQRLREKRLLLV